MREIALTAEIADCNKCSNKVSKIQLKGFKKKKPNPFQTNTSFLSSVFIGQSLLQVKMFYSATLEANLCWLLEKYQPHSELWDADSRREEKIQITSPKCHTAWVESGKTPTKGWEDAYCLLKLFLGHAF